jgi:hypothetical protein
VLQQVLLPTRSDSRAHIHCTHPASAAYLCHAGLQQLNMHTTGGQCPNCRAFPSQSACVYATLNHTSLHHSAWSPQWSMQPGQQMVMCAVLPPSPLSSHWSPLLRWGMRAMLYLYWGTCIVLSPSHIGYRCCAFFLSHAAEWPHACTCSSGRAQQQQEALNRAAHGQITVCTNFRMRGGTVIVGKPVVWWQSLTR